MKLKKTLSYKSSNKIWRLLLSEENNLLIQTMDPATREVFFNCFNTYKGKPTLKEFQLDEKYFCGVEAYRKEIIYFHKFQTPEMPNHKGIFAYSIDDKKFLWQEPEYEFYFIVDDKIICRKQLFESWNYKILNSSDGSLISDNISSEEVIELKAKKNLDENLLLPQNFDLQKPESEFANSFIKQKCNDECIIGHPEYVILNETLICNLHLKNKFNKFDNILFVIDLVKEKTIYSDKINSDILAFVPDSFFVKDDLLFLLKNTNEVNVFKVID